MSSLSTFIMVNSNASGELLVYPTGKFSREPPGVIKMEILSEIQEAIKKFPKHTSIVFLKDIKFLLYLPELQTRAKLHFRGTFGLLGNQKCKLDTADLKIENPFLDSKTFQELVACVKSHLRLKFTTIQSLTRCLESLSQCGDRILDSLTIAIEPHMGPYSITWTRIATYLRNFKVYKLVTQLALDLQDGDAEFPLPVEFQYLVYVNKSICFLNFFCESPLCYAACIDGCVLYYGPMYDTDLLDNFQKSIVTRTFVMREEESSLSGLPKELKRLLVEFIN